MLLKRNLHLFGVKRARGPCENLRNASDQENRQYSDARWRKFQLLYWKQRQRLREMGKRQGQHSRIAPVAVSAASVILFSRCSLRYQRRLFVTRKS